jgi:hypothetical protein
MRPSIAALFALAVAAPQAEAGRRPYAFVQGAESLDRGALELESWVSGKKRPDGTKAWDWWLGPVAGLTDRLEVGLFTIFTQQDAQGTPEAVQLSSLRFQASYALADRGAWPVDLRLRAEYGQPVGATQYPTAWLSAIASRQLGHLDLSANAGWWAWFDDEEVVHYITWGFGGSLEIVGGLRAGFETFGDSIPDHDDSTNQYVGPTLAFGRDRVWMSSTFAFGLTDTSAEQRGRVVIGLAF